jgi:hypothetical protein
MATKIEIGGGLFIPREDASRDELRSAIAILQERLLRQDDAIKRLRSTLSAALAKAEADCRAPDPIR